MTNNIRIRSLVSLSTAILLGAALLGSGCGSVRSIKKIKKNPLGQAAKTANEALSADEQIKLACRDAEDLFADIRALASELGHDYVLTAQIIHNIAVRANSIRKRVTRLIRGGLGTAIALGVNYEAVSATLQTVVAMVQGGSGNLTAGQLAEATNPDGQSGPEVVFANRPTQEAPPPKAPPSTATKAQPDPQKPSPEFDSYLAQVKARRDAKEAYEKKLDESWKVVSKVVADRNEKLHTKTRLLKGFVERFPNNNPYLVEAQRKLEKMLPGVMVIKSSPPGALVSISRGLAGGKTPLSLKAKAGTYLLSCTLRGHKRKTVSLKVKPGQMSRIEITMQESQPGTLSIKSTPPGAQILIDGKKAGKTPKSGKVKSGTYEVKVSMEDYLSASKTVEVISNSVSNVDLTLKAMAPGKLVVRAQPRGARLRIDEAPLVRLPLTKKLERGTYKLVVEAPGFDPQEQTVQLVSGKTSRVKFKLTRTPRTFLSIQTEPKGALIFIDGKRVGKAPLRRKYMVGTHVLKATLPNHDPAEQEVLLDREQETTTVMTLARGQGELLVETDPPGATISVGPDVLGPAPQTKTVPAGMVVIKASLDGYHPASRKVRIAMGPTRKTKLKLRPIKPALLTVKSRPAGAEVILDGQKVGVTPHKAQLPPGKYSLQVNLAGFDPSQRQLVLGEGKRGGGFFRLKKIPLSLLSVQTTPPGAMVTIDGKEEGPAPLKRKVLPGQHTIVALLDDHQPAEQLLNVDRKKPAQVQLTLAEIKRGKFTIQSDPPQAKMWLDDEELGPGLVVRELDIGSYKLRAELNKHTSVQRTLVVKGGEEEVVILALEPIPEGRLKVSTAPSGATLMVDGQPWGKSPQEKVMTPGVHKIEAQLADHETANKTTLVMNGQLSEISLELKSTNGVLAVVSTPSGAEVVLDGKSIGKTPLEKEMKAGSYNIQVLAKPYIPARQKAQVKKGDKTFLEFALDSNPDCLLTVKTKPDGATIVLDGQEIGQSPLEKKIPAGSHTVLITRENHEKQRKMIYAKPSQVSQLDLELVEVFDLDPLEKWGHSAFWTGLTMAGLGAAATFKSMELEDVNGGFRGADAQATTWSALMYTGLAAGGALMITGVVLWAISPDDEEYAKRNRTAIGPTPDGKGVTLSLGGEF